jgi:hypothetical protein
MGIDVDIELPLNALRNIPVRFAMTRKVDDLPGQSLTSKALPVENDCRNRADCSSLKQG